MKSKKEKLEINLYEMIYYEEVVQAFQAELKTVKPSNPKNFSNLICKFFKDQLEYGL